MSKKLVILYADDWEALYVDGELVTQGHSITVDEIAEALGEQIEQFEVSTAGGKELYDVGEFDVGFNLEQAKAKYVET